MKKRQRNWDAEDDLFRRQVGQLCGVSGMSKAEQKQLPEAVRQTILAKLK